MFRSEPTLAPGLLHPQEEPAGQHLAWQDKLAGEHPIPSHHSWMMSWCPFKVLLRPRFSYVLGELWYWRSSIFACRCPCPDHYPRLLLGSTWDLGPPLSIPIPFHTVNDLRCVFERSPMLRRKMPIGTPFWMFWAISEPISPKQVRRTGTFRCTYSSAPQGAVTTEPGQIARKSRMRSHRLSSPMNSMMGLNTWRDI